MRARPDLGKPDQVALQRGWGRDAARLLALLRQERPRGVTVEMMRQRGIEAPAQAIYTLQLAGYTIDRLSGAASRHRMPVSGRRESRAGEVEHRLAMRITSWSRP